MRLLIVGDDRGSAGEATSALGAEGCGNEVIYVRECAAATRRIEAGEHFDAALVDAAVKSTGGLSGVADLCANCPELPVVTLTADTDPDIALCAIRAGAQDALLESEATPGTVVRVMRCAVERHRREARLRDAAMRDDLTGLLNRRGIRNALAATMRPGANREPEPCALLTLDLDDFKMVNDRFGHPAGDTLLFLVGQRIARCLRSCDHVGRTGGDEFVVILCRLRRFEAVSIVVRKIARVFTAPFQLGRWRVAMSASIGVATFPADAETAPVLVRCSDRALFEAKRRGKHQHLAWRDLVLEGRVRRPKPMRDDADYYISTNAVGR